ncbi:HK97 family phage prohead protease [Salmonella enterica subsp. enterica serovar Miami]|nr:HK97 family phage prohead protease [Salmonella enterica subsp. enterica serovar Miami]
MSRKSYPNVSHDDVVVSGAFAASLRAWSDRKALPALLWQHRMDEPVGVYTEMKEDDVGLFVRGRLLIDDDPLAKRAHAHMKAGSLSYDAVHDVRQLIWKALLGWEPDPQAHEIQYAGGMLLDLNRHELYYQFDFTAKYEITEEDSRQQEDLDVLPDLKTLSIDVDFIEPGTGPDGNIEHHTGITLP